MQFNRDADIQFAGYSMWVDGYQFPDSTEYWDANWVQVRVVCTGQQATVKLCGSCVHLPELSAWLDSCIRLEAGSVESAALPTMEPYVRVTIDRSEKPDGLLAIVKLTPDNISQFHEFRFQIDHSHLPKIIASLSSVLTRWPIRGSQ